MNIHGIAVAEYQDSKETSKISKRPKILCESLFKIQAWAVPRVTLDLLLRDSKIHGSQSRFKINVKLENNLLQERLESLSDLDDARVHSFSRNRGCVSGMTWLLYERVLYEDTTLTLTKLSTSRLGSEISRCLPRYAVTVNILECSLAKTSCQSLSYQLQRFRSSIHRNTSLLVPPFQRLQSVIHVPH